MLIKVVNRENPKINELYANVNKITDVFDENGNYCHRLHIGNETATYPACEWDFYKMDWFKIF